MALKTIQGHLRSGTSAARVAGLGLVLTVAAVVGGAGTARAAYPGANGAIAFEAFSAGDGNAAHDELETGSRTITACRATSSDSGLACVLGGPSYSPDGRTIVVSRLVPAPAVDPTDGLLSGAGDQGALTLVRADGTGLRSLPRQTLDDEHPAFLPSATKIVFDGRRSPHAPLDLFTVRADGKGLRPLTRGGGSQPAPCRNGAIAFVKRGDIYLLARHRRTQRRITFRGGDAPDCSPDSQMIAFVRKGAVYTIGTNGGHLRRVASAQPIPGEANGGVYAAVFSPSGREIAFLANYTDQAGNADIELEVDRGGRRAAPARSVAGSGLDIGTGEAFDGSVAGVSWQPVLAR